MLINRVNGGFLLSIKLAALTQIKWIVLMPADIIFRNEMGYYNLIKLFTYRMQRALMILLSKDEDRELEYLLLKQT